MSTKKIESRLFKHSK